MALNPGPFSRPASSGVSGLVNTIAQSFQGVKTFLASLVAAAGLEVQSAALHVTGAPSGLTAGAHAWMGSYNGSSAAALWLGNASTSPSASNYSILAYAGGGLFLNAPPNNPITFAHNAVSIGTLSSTGVFTLGTTTLNNGNVTLSKSSAPVFIYAAGSSGTTETVRLVAQRGDAALKCVVAGTEQASPNAAAVLFQTAKGVVTTASDAGNGTLTGLRALGDGTVECTDTLGLNTNGSARPAANAANRGRLWYSKSADGVADTVEMCMKSAGDTYSWKVIATG